MGAFVSAIIIDCIVRYTCNKLEVHSWTKRFLVLFWISGGVLGYTFSIITISLFNIYCDYYLGILLAQLVMPATWVIDTYNDVNNENKTH